jgi:hypothetical protein
MFDPAAEPRCRELPARAAEAFRTQAEFDDPLVGGAAYGCEIDFAGEVRSEGRPMLRILVIQHLTKTYYLLVDPETYLIAQRVERLDPTASDAGDLVTTYDAYRPVGGTLLPHRIAVWAKGAPGQEAIFDRVEANPDLAPAVFQRPE